MSKQHNKLHKLITKMIHIKSYKEVISENWPKSLNEDLPSVDKLKNYESVKKGNADKIFMAIVERRRKQIQLAKSKLERHFVSRMLIQTFFFIAFVCAVVVVVWYATR